MIYLIGWPPKCWKTTLAKKLLELNWISMLSTDTLQNVIKPYVGMENFGKMFPATCQKCEDNDEKFFKYSLWEIIEAYRVQAQTCFDAIDMVMISEITDKNDFIMEGYYIEPRFVKKLILKYPDKVKSIFLVKTSKEKFIRDVKKTSTPNDWIINRTKDENTYWKIADMICDYWKVFQSEAEKYWLKVLNMDDDFYEKLEWWIDYLVNR